MSVSKTQFRLGLVGYGEIGTTLGAGLARISHAAWCIGVSERVKLVLRERVEPGRRVLPDAHTL